MSSFLHKLDQMEVNPPDDMWARVAAELDQVPVQNKLYDLSLEAPPGSWEKISNELDHSLLKERLENIEVPASSLVWSSINDSLDNSFFDRLKDVTVEPPASSWNKIAAGLTDQAPVVKMSSRSNWLKYAAAVMVLIGIGAVLILSRNNNSQQDLADNSPSKASPALTLPTDSSSSAILTNIKTDGNDVPEAKTIEVAHAGKRINRSASSALYAYNEKTPIADRYVMLMTPEGSIVRMSKKLGDLICCVSGEESDSQCKDQLKKWQAQLADLPTASSSSNFLDILSLVNSLDETEL